MRKILLLIVLFGVTITGVRAQVGIGTKKPHKAAQLEVTSDPSNPGARGVLIPRVSLTSLEMTLADINAADKDQMPNSILIFNTNSKVTGYDGKNYGIGYYYWDSTVTNTNFTHNKPGAWVPLLSGGTSRNISNFFNSINTNSSTVVYNANSNTLEVKVWNGLKEFVENGQARIGLGGALTTSTTIVTSQNNTLAITGLQEGVASDVLVVADPATGILRTISGVTTAQIDPGSGNEGKVLTVISTTTGGNVVSWTTIDGTDTRTIDLSGVAGDGLTYSSTTGMLNIGAGNGITVTSNTVEWGGELTKTVTIVTTDTTPFVIQPKAGTTTSTLIIKDLPDGDKTDKLVVVDADGRVRKVDPKAAATIDYTSTPTTTGRKWTLPAGGGTTPQNLEIKEVTFKVNFDHSSTVEIFKKLRTYDTSFGANEADKLMPISVRAIKVDGPEISITQSGSYEPNTAKDEGNLTLGMSGNGFTVAHDGDYFIVIEYYVKP